MPKVDIKSLNIAQVRLAQDNLFFGNYIRNNITINVYVVNQLWLFSYYWCVGVDSITTGRCGFMTNPSLRPLMLMNSSTYFALVSSMHLLCLLSMAIIFQFKISRINKQKDFVDLSKQA
ncbi:unnamed protein product [Gordionus sp. m RMFG-2023]